MKNKNIDAREYDEKVFIKRMNIFLCCLVLLILSSIISINSGHLKLAPLDTLRTMLGNGTARENLVLFDIRLPRILISILIGMGLAVSGCVIQNVTKNDLAEPGLLGINAGAGLMVIIYTLLNKEKSFNSILIMPFLALLGASLTAFIIYKVAYKKEDGLSPMRLILTGIGVQAGLTALTTLLVVKLDDTQFNMIATWQAGSIWGSNYQDVIIICLWLIVLIPYILYKSKVLDVLNLGDEISHGLGIDVEKERRYLIGGAVAISAICVAVGENISFVGLIAPHVAKKLVGPKNMILIPTSALVGGVLVSVADTIARVILPTSEIPTGIVVAIIGAPYFLYLFAKSKY